MLIRSRLPAFSFAFAIKVVIAVGILWRCLPLDAREPWTDPRLPKIGGLQVWLDAEKCRGTEPVREFARLQEWRDGSGHGRHVVQPEEKQRPTIATIKDSTVVRFDGLDDHLTQAALAAEFGEVTIFLVGTPFANPGTYRGFLAVNREGVNDYVSGLNIDQGHAASQTFQTVNVEGAGFGGERDLLEATFDFGTPHILGLICQPAKNGVRLFVDGRTAGQRDRQPGTLRMDRLTIGARFYNNGGPANVRDFLEGDLAEVLIFDHALSDNERRQVERYLSEKHTQLLHARVARPAPQAGVHRLVSVPSPPVQMFVPGFTVRELPIALTNINNVRYREDGKLIAVGYNGNIHVLSDTDGDGLEDKSELFWESNGRTQPPIGMALTPPKYPHGRGVFLPVVGKLSLIVDDNGDDKGDREVIVAKGWKPLEHQVDSFGVAVDPRDGSVYFGLGTEQYANAYVIDANGRAHYDLASERGTIQRVAPDFRSREIICTGVRFSVGLAFNRLGDLFCSEQEGATWLANGNPFDELLHIQRGRHYGFPPRHPKHLPRVIDEPSTFDYTPQHQSTCGLQFNEAVNGGPTFGPRQWEGDAIVTGYSRGKLYRTKLVKSTVGYVAQNQLVASLNALTVDACITPRGQLVVATHSGGPDWGTGPGGSGKLYQVAYSQPDLPQPVLAWPQGPFETHIAFDRPLPQESLKQLLDRMRIEFGSAVAAGDRFEFHRPGYEIVHQQLNQPRHELAVHAAQITPDRRTLVLTTDEQSLPVGYAITIFGDAARATVVKSGDEERNRALTDSAEPSSVRKSNASDTDLAYTLHGVRVKWVSADAQRQWTGWLPHLDTQVARELTKHSSQHDEFWSLVREPGQLTLTTRLDISSMLRPAVQPGAKLDYTWPPEVTTVAWRSRQTFALTTARGKAGIASATQQEVSFPPDQMEPIEITLRLTTGGDLELTTDWRTNEDERGRPFPLRRFFVPWARSAIDASAQSKMDRPELVGGSWARGRQVFFDGQVGCAKCHSVGGHGAKFGPDLTNVVHRDYNSVLRDVMDPSFAINPEFITHVVTLNDGRTLTGVLRQEGEQLLVGNERGEITTIASANVESSQPSTVSTMPKGLPQPLGPDRLRDLLTFLLTPPPRMPDYGSGQPPAARKREELAAVLAGAPSGADSTRPLKLVLVAGPKDHGPGEHDYPAWQSVWREWLACAGHVTVETANRWPSAEQLATADVLVFYQQGEWNAERTRDLDAFQARGGGAVYLHYAVDGGKDPIGFAERIGLAWKGGASKFRHGALELHFERGSSHPIARNFSRVDFVDETYWGLLGDNRRVSVFATAVEENMPQPIFWSLERNASTPGATRGRVVVSILGHYSWTFDDPLFRLLVLRSIAWAAHEPVDRFNDIVTLGARLE